MASIQTQIADAVVTALNAATLGETFTAVRTFAPEFTIPELDTLRVSVVPTSIAERITSRSQDEADVVVGVLVQQRVTSETTAGIDQDRVAELVELCEKIDELFRHKDLSDLASWSGTEYTTIYDPKHLKDHLVFSSLVTFTFTFWR